MAVAAILYLPTPYVVMAPGDAVDLRDAIRIDGRPAPPHPLYLTDVLVYPASPLGLVLALVPGFRLLPRSELEPSGVPLDRYRRVLKRSMDESQQAAAVVAERAAGYHVATPPSRVRVVAVLQRSNARGLLQPGDVVVTADGKPVGSLARMIDIVGTHRVGGPPVHLRIDRNGVARSFAIGTIDSPEGLPRVGVLIAAEPSDAKLPVPVHFGGELDRISGSSGGLMMALDIYGTLTGRPVADAPIAGTGTIDFDGNVGPIDGAPQKVIAAKRVGAKIFLCPRDNYAEIKATSGIRVIPVGTFDQARKVLERAEPSAA